MLFYLQPVKNIADIFTKSVRWSKIGQKICAIDFIFRENNYISRRKLLRIYVYYITLINDSVDLLSSKKIGTVYCVQCLSIAQHSVF